MLNHSIKLYVPGTIGGAIDRTLQNAMTDNAMDEFATWFGGATVTEARGVWKKQPGQAGQRAYRPGGVVHRRFRDEPGMNRTPSTLRKRLRQ